MSFAMRAGSILSRPLNIDPMVAVRSVSLLGINLLGHSQLEGAELQEVIVVLQHGLCMRPIPV